MKDLVQIRGSVEVNRRDLLRRIKSLLAGG